VGVAHLQTEGFEYNIAVVVALAASGPRATSVTRDARRAVAISAAIATIAITLGPTGSTVAVAVDCTGHTIVIAIGYASPAVEVTSAARCAAIVGELHWAVAVILSIHPLQRKHVAVSVVRFVNAVSSARFLSRTLVPAVITRINTLIARLTASVRRLAASIRRVCSLATPVTVLACSR
jgi:hypothetical protein